MATMGETRTIRRRPLGSEEDPRKFEKGREVHEERTRNVSEEADEEDRRKWEETREIGKEAHEIPEDKHDRPPMDDGER
jgi:hypothetical protein